MNRLEYLEIVARLDKLEAIAGQLTEALDSLLASQREAPTGPRKPLGKNGGLDG